MDLLQLIAIMKRISHSIRVVGMCDAAYHSQLNATLSLLHHTPYFRQLNPVIIMKISTCLMQITTLSYWLGGSWYGVYVSKPERTQC